MSHPLRTGLPLFGIAGLLLAAAPALTQPPEEKIPPPREFGVFRLQVPSEAAGTEGIAVRLTLPERPRYYRDGAPVVVIVPGGLGPGGLDGPPLGATALGFATVQFTFPGGPGSGGTFDQRGPASLAALRDVVRFALGEQASGDGRTIQDYAGRLLKVNTRNVGMLGLSNGGNQAIAVAGLFGGRLRSLAWIVNWESPVGPGMVNAELGSWFNPPLPGQKPDEKGNPLVNPAYNPDTGKLDLTKLAYSPALEVTPFPPRPGKPGAAKFPPGGLYFDINGNGKVDPGTDFVPYPLVIPGKEGPKIVYSLHLQAEAEARQLYGERRPAHLASVEEAAEFWRYRDGSLWVRSAVGNCPRLMFLVVAGERDHFQSAPDHPHIRFQYLAFREASSWLTRLNPDQSYVQLLAGKEVKAADNPARAVFDAKTIRAALEPEPSKGGAPTLLLQLAALCEVADRTQTDNTKPQLDAVLYSFAPPLEEQPMPPAK